MLVNTWIWIYMRRRELYLGYYLDMDIYDREKPVSWLLPGYGYI